MRSLCKSIILLWAFAFLWSSQAQLLPPTPESITEIPTGSQPPGSSVPLPARVPRALPPRPPVTMRPYTPPAQTQPRPSADPTAFQFDSTLKEYTAKPGDLNAAFTFAVTNISKADAVINWIRPSCGCTLAKHTPTPWKLAPGEGGLIELNLDLRGKSGVLSKYVSVDTSHGQKLLNIRATIPANAAPTANKKGQALFAAACAICHEAPHRATMVPDLAMPKVPVTKEYWKHWVTNGKPGSLMPAFDQAQGGPLSTEQIDSLVEYLTQYYPPKKVVATATPATED